MKTNSTKSPTAAATLLGLKTLADPPTVTMCVIPVVIGAVAITEVTAVPPMNISIIVISIVTITVITLLITVGIIIIELDVLDIVGVDIMVDIEDIEDILLADIDDIMLDIVIETMGGGGASEVPSVLEPEPCTGNSPGVD